MVKWKKEKGRGGRNLLVTVNKKLLVLVVDSVRGRNRKKKAKGQSLPRFVLRPLCPASARGGRIKERKGKKEKRSMCS